MASVEYGNLPTWVSAIGTTGALLINALLLRKALNERSEALQEKRQDQASKVSAWTDGQARSILVRNGSEAVVDNCFIDMWYKKSGAPPGDPAITPVELHVGTIPPMTTREVEIPWEEPLQWALTGIVFRDAKGRYWTRGKSDGLKENRPPWETSRSKRFKAWLKSVIPWRRSRKAIDLSEILRAGRPT
ncbi:hypothetical protein AB0B88_18475 [Micromonospora haikouensis]|uniref:hypothetical protein n=1 Tax=Micromonospora haikouensis TaxID=686309 RepID=UPI00340721E3